MRDTTVRRIDFPFPEEIDPVSIPGQPEASVGLLGLSLLLPYLEPYLIRSMKAARKHVKSLACKPEWVERYGDRAGRRARQREDRGSVQRNFPPKLPRTYRPGYTPDRPHFSEDMQAVARAYSERADGILS